MSYDKLKSQYEELTDGVLFITKLEPFTVPVWTEKGRNALIDIRTPRSIIPSHDRSEGFQKNYIQQIQTRYVEPVTSHHWLFCWVNPQIFPLDWHLDVSGDHDMFMFTASSVNDDSEGTMTCCFDYKHEHTNNFQLKLWTLYYMHGKLYHRSPPESGSTRMIYRWYNIQPQSCKEATNEDDY